MLKKLFFKMHHYNKPELYDEAYSSEHCIQENKAVSDAIQESFRTGLVVYDIGCGSGLGYHLLDRPFDYFGVDCSRESIRFCRQSYNGRFILADARQFARSLRKLNFMFLYSLDYLDLKTIRTYLERTDSVFLAVHYHKPYLNPDSAYYRHPIWFWILHPFWKRHRLLALFQEHGAVTTRLLDEDGYWLTVWHKN